MQPQSSHNIECFTAIQITQTYNPALLENMTGYESKSSILFVIL